MAKAQENDAAPTPIESLTAFLNAEPQRPVTRDVLTRVHGTEKNTRSAWRSLASNYRGSDQ